MQSHVKKNKLEDRPITNVELRLVQARLLAIMSGIDGKVLEVENLVAESMLELLDKKEAYEALPNLHSFTSATNKTLNQSSK